LPPLIAGFNSCDNYPNTEGVIQSKNLYEIDGVIVGEHLFLGTYNMIRSLVNSCKHRNYPPIVASGGASNISEIVDLIATGANAIQLCTVLDVMGPQVLLWLKEQLKKLIKEYGEFEVFSKNIKEDASKWQKAAELAKTYGFDQHRIVDKALKDTDYILNIFKDSISVECSEDVKIDECTAPCELPSNSKFAVIFGNASSFFLSRSCVLKYNLIPLEFESTSNFIKAAANSDFDYDFAIIPRSSLIYLQKQKELIPYKNFPVELGKVANSVYELVGKKDTNLEDIETIYYFGGNSSRNALGDLLKHHKYKSLELIKSKKKLLPLFQFWDDSSAILIKPPLSRIYGLLGREDLKDNWSVIWQTQEELLLVTSKELVNKDKDCLIIKSMINNMTLERSTLLKNPLKGAYGLINFGFLNHCSDLLVS